MNNQDLELNDLTELLEPSNSAATVSNKNSQWEMLKQKQKHRNDEMQKSLDRTANNTQEAIEHLREINTLQKEQLENLKRQLANDEKIIKLINDFLSCENGSELDNKELLNIIKGQVDSNHPILEYLADKGGDAFVSIFLSPILKSLKLYLMAKIM